MKCTECDSTMTKTIGDHVYRESGLNNVILRGIPKYTCESCGAKRFSITAVTSLHLAIARALAHKPARLLPNEVAFLRDHLELPNKDFAELMGVTQERASRWTTSDPIGVPAERFLRMLAVLGPEVIAHRIDRDISTVEISTVELVGTLGDLPPSTAQATDIAVNLRRAGNAGWTAAEAAPN